MSAPGARAARGFFAIPAMGGGSTVTTKGSALIPTMPISPSACARPDRLRAPGLGHGREVDLTQITMRVHPGGAHQQPDALIVAKEGAEPGAGLSRARLRRL